MTLECVRKQTKILNVSLHKHKLIFFVFTYILVLWVSRHAWQARFSRGYQAVTDVMAEKELKVTKEARERLGPRDLLE